MMADVGLDCLRLGSLAKMSLSPRFEALQHTQANHTHVIVSRYAALMRWEGGGEPIRFVIVQRIGGQPVESYTPCCKGCGRFGGRIAASLSATTALVIRPSLSRFAVRRRGKIAAGSMLSLIRLRFR